MVLHNYMGGVIPPACPGSQSGCPPGWTWLPRETYRRHLVQMSELLQAALLGTEKHQLLFDLLILGFSLAIFPLPETCHDWFKTHWYIVPIASRLTKIILL